MNQTNFFPIHRPVFFWSLLSGLIIIIVMANNFFYYQSRDQLAELTLRSVMTTLKTQYESCLDKSSVEVCQEILGDGIKKDWFYGRVTAVNSDGKILADTNSENYKDERKTVKLTGVAGEGLSAVNFVLSKKSSPFLYISTFRSLTFSLDEWSGKKNLGQFLIKTVLPKSSPFIYSAVTIWILLLMVRASDKMKQKVSEKIESENFIIKKDLEMAKSNGQTLLAEKIDLEERMKAQAESENKLLDEYYQNSEQVKKLEQEILASKLKESELTIELEKNVNKQTRLKLNEDKDPEKNIQKILLSNPDVELQDKEFNYNDGRHHSKDFVDQVARGLLSDPISSRIIVKINSARYGSHKGGEAVLDWETKKKVYVLNVYDRDDAGYAAELVLSKNIEEAVFMSKYLVSVKGYLARNKFVLKFGKELFSSRNS